MRLFSLVCACGLGLASAAHANGRMPGANDVAFDHGDPQHLVARATFGIVQSFDAGKHWQWVCEQIIDVSGVIADPPLAVMSDGTQVLLPPTGSALVSHNHGCQWERTEAPLSGRRGVDLTLDAQHPERLLLLMSTLKETDEQGYGLYENLVVESSDNGHSFHVLASLPTDFEAETLEVAASDDQRLYVSGTDSKNARLGILERSEDGGATWVRSTLGLPPGTGSLFISAIAPDNPDRLWVRVPARGDTLGILPASLLVSEDKGASFRMLAATQKAMFGFALSPDGSKLAYGGPADGLFVGPSDGSGGFERVNSLSVRCLRWTQEQGLYACGTEPRDAFSLGASTDDGRSFQPLYRMVDTCPASCDDGTPFAASCQAAWSTTRPFIGAAASMCSVPWAAPPASGMGASDAGPAVGDGGLSRDAALPHDDAGASEPPFDADIPAGGCSCRTLPARRVAPSALLTVSWSLFLFGWLVRRKRRRGATA
jgi:photosystem II stability/assembly factor-like uncharacterized protein